MSENNEKEKILNLLLCPICFVHPENEVFQCHNGHHICSFCTERLLQCPQCEIPFEIPLIRCRAIESLLDTVSLPCVNKDAGCNQEFLRKELPNHQETCDFRSINFCEWMGFECNFAASTAAPLVNHLESSHDAKRGTGFIWKNANNFHTSASSRYLVINEWAGDLQNSEKSWILVFVTITCRPNDSNFFSCLPILLQDGPCTAEHKVELKMSIGDPLSKIKKERFLSNWTGFPSNYKDAEEDILHPSFQVTTNFLRKQAFKLLNLTEFSFTLGFSVTVTPTAISSIQEDENSSQNDNCLMPFTEFPLFNL